MTTCGLSLASLIVLGAMVCSVGAVDDCPCEEEAWCDPITARKNRHEVFAFVRDLNANPEYWSNFFWDKITTISTLGFIDDRLTCMAHRHGVRVLFTSDHISPYQATNDTVRQSWVEEQVAKVNEHFLDGVNIDQEDEFRLGTPETRGVSGMIIDLKTALMRNNPSRALLAVDTPYHPQWFIRHFEYPNITAHVDLFFVMAYDEGAPNSGFFKTLWGLGHYFTFNVPLSKLVLGLPWYGINLKCSQHYSDYDPQSSVNQCSHISWSQTDISHLYRIWQTHGISDMLWDNDQLIPYFYYKDPRGESLMYATTENGRSLRYKTDMAIQHRIAGIGIFPISYFNYSDPIFTAQMYNCIPEY